MIGGRGEVALPDVVVQAVMPRRRGAKPGQNRLVADGAMGGIVRSADLRRTLPGAIGAGSKWRRDRDSNPGNP